MSLKFSLHNVTSILNYVFFQIQKIEQFFLKDMVTVLFLFLDLTLAIRVLSPEANNCLLINNLFLEIFTFSQITSNSIRFIRIFINK